MNPRPRPARRWLLPAAGVLLALLALGIAWKWWPAPETEGPASPAAQAEAPDPRLTYPTRYRNVRPGVKYVGDSVCARCHRDIAASYSRHPMAHSLAPVSDATPIERYDPTAFNPFAAPDPFVAGGLHYRVERRDGHVLHHEWAAGPDGGVLTEAVAEVQFAVGSGRRGRSYLVNHDGFLFQSPITWYPQAGRWDLSPGYGRQNKHFGRPITVGCLFCHCNHADHVAPTINRYRQPVFQGYAVGCERCHGPGELHVALRRRGEDPGGVDYTIVNPGRLEPALREAVCQQCHLSSEHRVVARGRADFDYRPGLPLPLFLMDFVGTGEGHEDYKFVGTVEQMAASRCYRASRAPNKLGCTSCHDPHRLPAPHEQAAFYRQRCLRCHTEHSCGLAPAVRRQQNKEDSCVACHMPRTGSEVSHTSITDHRIPRQARGPGKGPAGPRPLPTPDGLVPFHRDLLEPADAEVSRNRGVALIGMLEYGPRVAAARQFAAKALPFLDRALERDAADVPAWESKAAALWCLRRPKEALAAYQKALAQQPERETALHDAGKIAFALNEMETGRALLERAVRVNPWRWQYHHLLAADAYQARDWGRAARELQESLRLEPFNSTSRRRLLVGSYLRLGEKEKAGAEFDRLMQLVPEDRRPELRRWLEAQPP
jgi:hypothetical protein